MAFSDKMRHYRTALGMTQSELADRLGISQKAVSSWETGRTDPNLGQVAEMCRIFDCQMEDLTETRARKVGEVTMEDILVYISATNMSEVMTIQKAAEMRAQYLNEVNEAMREKRMLEQKMSEMQKRIADLERLQQSQFNFKRGNNNGNA